MSRKKEDGNIPVREPFNLEKFMQRLTQAMTNNKNQAARTKGQADQLIADSNSATYDAFFQLIQPLVADHTKQTLKLAALEKELKNGKTTPKKTSDQATAPPKPVPKAK